MAVNIAPQMRMGYALSAQSSSLGRMLGPQEGLGASLSISESEFRRNDYKPLAEREKVLAMQLELGPRVEQQFVTNQVRTFIEEYMTGKSESHYAYNLDGGSLRAEGWDGDLRASFWNAPFVEGIGIEQQALRAAELHSWEQINYALTDPAGLQEDRVAILQSPPRGHGYGFVSFYRREAGSSRVDVTLSRVWDQFRDKSDLEVRQCWALDHSGAVQNIELPETTAQEIQARQAQLPENTKRQLESDPTCQILSSALLISGENAARSDMSPKELINEYYSNREVQAKLGNADLITSSLLEDFMPEIHDFSAALYADIRETHISEHEYQEFLLKKFKQLLINAKIYFDYEDASRIWGEDKVKSLADLIRLKSREPRQLAVEQQLEALDTVWDGYTGLEVQVSGDCGDFKSRKLNAAGIGEVLSAISNPSSALASVLELTETICSDCGIKYAISVFHKQYQPSCVVCGKDFSC